MDRGAGRSTGRRPPGLPRQFAFRAVLVIAGLTLLLVVDVRGAGFYFAWALIGLALASEATATFVHWRRSREE